MVKLSKHVISNFLSFLQPWIVAVIKGAYFKKNVAQTANKVAYCSCGWWMKTRLKSKDSLRANASLK